MERKSSQNEVNKVYIGLWQTWSMGSEDLFSSQTVHKEVSQLFIIMVTWRVQAQIKNRRMMASTTWQH